MSEKRKHKDEDEPDTPDRKRVIKHVYGKKFFGPYLSERQWCTVREETLGNCWDSSSYEKITPGCYRWGEDGIFGLSDEEQKLCMALSLWNKKDPFIKERFFGLTGPQGNHGEDVKELFYYLDSDPDHNYKRAEYLYPQMEFPYKDLIEKNKERTPGEPEYEILDTGVFDEGHPYWEIQVEYAKPEPGVVLCRYTVTNHGELTSSLDIIPQFWFRNYYHPKKNQEIPCLEKTEEDTVSLRYEFGNFSVKFAVSDLDCSPDIELRETSSRQKHTKAPRCYVTYHLQIPPGRQDSIEWQLSPLDNRKTLNLYNISHSIKEVKSKADMFYSSLYDPSWSDSEKHIAKGAWSGLLWNKQFYYYDIQEWYNGGQAKEKDSSVADKPGNWDVQERNIKWRDHFKACDILSVPDKWEFPWFASWDTCFQMIPFCRLDPEFAKHQLLLLLSDRYMSPDGQIPGCEFNFDDNNPPLHAWACLKVFQMTGGKDINFLTESYSILKINYKWWMTNLQCSDRWTFHGGFLGLDNISVIDRGCPPQGYTIKQADATAWMALFALSMLETATEIIRSGSSCQENLQGDMDQYLEDFICISEQINKNIIDGGFWNPSMMFYNDVLVDKSTDKYIPIEVKSLVGLLPLVACSKVSFSGISCPQTIKQLVSRKSTHVFPLPDEEKSYFLTCVPLDRIESLLDVLFDEKEFLSPFGIRSLSKIHTQPYKLTLPIKSVMSKGDSSSKIAVSTHQDSSKSCISQMKAVEEDQMAKYQSLKVDDAKEVNSTDDLKGDKSATENIPESPEFSVHYTPGESDSGIMGGNSNWRGPIWMNANYILIDTLEKLHTAFGDKLKVRYPGFTTKVSLNIAKKDVCRRLVSIFLPDINGARPLHGEYKQYTKHFWKDLILYYEYFHGDTGRGCGASHQTGWTALISEILYKLYH